MYCYNVAYTIKANMTNGGETMPYVIKFYKLNKIVKLAHTCKHYYVSNWRSQTITTITSQPINH